MRSSSTERLALGTVQFGQAYGIANRTGQIGRAEAAQILQEARGAGARTLDTAVAYGESEACLGDIGVADWQVISKLPALPADCADVANWVDAAVTGSLRRLRLDRLTALLLHRPADLLGVHGETLGRALRQQQAEGRIGHLGVSIYDPAELGLLLPRFPIEVVQVPFNVIDRRLLTSGWLDRLAMSGIRVHVRSIFLQGLLLMKPEDRPVRFGRWDGLWRQWTRWLADAKLTPVQACLGFALSHPGIERVVVGVDGIGHWREIAAGAAPLSAPPPAALESSDLDLIHPPRWNEPPASGEKSLAARTGGAAG